MQERLPFCEKINFFCFSNLCFILMIITDFTLFQQKSKIHFISSRQIFKMIMNEIYL